MSRKRTDKQYLSDILLAMERILSYVEGMSYQDFLVDYRTQDAVIRNLEIIGEASKRLTAQFRLTHATIPWREMARLRDRVIHHYFGINYDIIWEVVTKDIPQLLPTISEIR